MTINDLTVIDQTTALSNELLETVKQTVDYINNAKSVSTRKAYDNDWKHFSDWCAAHGTNPLPADPKAVAIYLSDMTKDYKVSTIQRHLTAISQKHRDADLESPLLSSIVRKTMKGIKRSLSTAPQQKKAAVTSDLKAMVEALPSNLLGIRDRALLLIGFAGAFRRSELVGLDVEDLEFKTEGVVITLRHSKTDQEGEGIKKAIFYGRNGMCPVNALKRWLEAAGIVTGPVFRRMNRHGRVSDSRLTDQVVAKVVKRTAKAAGLDSSLYSGHSLRAGLATAAASVGCQERDIMKQTGHKSVEMVRRYIREGELFKNNVTGSIW